MSHKTALRGSLKMQLTEQSKNGRSKGIAVWTMSPSNGSSGSTVTALFGHHIVCNEEEERVRSLDYELPAGAVTHAKKRIGKGISFWEQTSKGCLSHSPDMLLYLLLPSLPQGLNALRGGTHTVSVLVGIPTTIIMWGSAIMKVPHFPICAETPI